MVRGNKIIMKKIFSITLLYVLVFPAFSQASTNINNSISITASGGNNSVQIKTTHNGEVIEDINLTSSSTIEYSSKNIITEENKIASSTISKQKSDSEEITRLKTLLEKLQLILKLYEKLMAEKI